jgi:arsenate reductase
MGEQTARPVGVVSVYLADGFHRAAGAAQESHRRGVARARVGRPPGGDTRRRRWPRAHDRRADRTRLGQRDEQRDSRRSGLGVEMPGYRAELVRRAFAEFLGTGLLVAVVVGSGIMAARLSPNDVGLELLENSTATAFGLTALILMLAPVSGAHFNPVVTLADFVLGRRTGTGVSANTVAAYIPAQIAGGIGGTILANLMFALPAVTTSTHARGSGHLWLGETVATAGLILLIFSLVRTGRGALAAPAVGAYIGAAYWFTSSTSFANPAVTIARAFTDTFAGIAPGSILGFVAFQVIGAAVGVGLVMALYPHPRPHTAAS